MGAPATAGRRRRVPDEVVNELQQAGATGHELTVLIEELADAIYSFERERYGDARRYLRHLARRAPTSPAVRELHGLVLYRMGKWSAAAEELEAFRTLTGSLDQHPILADCYRAMKRYRKADELWAELRTRSPGAELVAEGRIVAAGCLADQGDLAGAIRLLEAGVRPVRRAEDRHFRLWYALADLYERAGEVGRARALFARLADQASDAYDAAGRLRALG
jgi:tetratricopeptide (TPR) repeat protein